MKRRTLTIAVGLLLAASGMRAAEPKGNPAGSKPPAAPAGRLNIVVIMADDHGRQAIGCYGGRFLPTPNIDRLSREGMRFTDAMANNSICSPSRATMITGKYNHLCGVKKLDGHFDGTQQTFPKLLQQAGYQTAIVGKWHLFTQPTGFDFYSVLPGQGRYNDCPLKETGQPWGDNGNQGGVVHPGYLTDVITDVGLNWLEKRRRDRPFCLLIHHKAPHSPHVPAPRHKNLLKGLVFPEPANLLDDYKGRAPEPVADALAWSRLIQNPEAQYELMRRQFTGDTAHDTRLAYQTYLPNYLRLVATLDENVGRVLDYLDRSGLARNTVVVYTSDNGYFLGEHGFYNKMWMYEEGFHIPLIVRTPGGRAGAVNHDLVSMLDLAPTVLDLAGVKVPADIQGRSYMPLLTGEPVIWRDAMYYHYYGVEGKPREGNWIAYHEIMGVRTKTAKLIYYPNWKNGPFWEYFDLTSDPREMTNLYHDPQRQSEVRGYKERLHRLAEYFKDPGARKIE